MHVTLRQLELFAALARHGSVTAAARACHVTQPTVSAQLADLAGAVGLPLYEIVGRRLHLTAAGEALLATARAMRDQWSAFGQHVDALQGLTRGRLRVALVNTAEHFVPRLVGAFCARHPQIEVALEIANRDGLIRRLRDNLDDLYVMSQPPADLDLAVHPFLPNPLVVIASRRHPLVRRRAIPVAKLAGERFILRERGSGTRLACDAHFERARFTPKVQVEVGSNEAIRQLVASGLGVGIVSRHALAGARTGAAPVELDVAGFPLRSSWSLLYPRGKLLSPVAHAFLAHLLAVRGTA